MPKKYTGTARKTRPVASPAKQPKKRNSRSNAQTVDFTSLDVDAPKPAKRTAVLLKMEPEVLAFFKAGGKGYQTRINRVLRFYIEDVRRASARNAEAIRRSEDAQ